MSLLRRNAERRSPKAGRRVRRLLLRAGVATTLGRGRAGLARRRNTQEKSLPDFQRCVLPVRGLTFVLGLAPTRNSLRGLCGKEFDAIPSVLLGRIHTEVGLVKEIRHRLKYDSGKSRLSPC